MNTSEQKHYAVRHVEGRDESGEHEQVSIWIDRDTEGAWRVGRAVDQRRREFVGPDARDVVFTGYEMQDALAAANGALEDDLAASADTGVSNDGVLVFTETELQDHLTRHLFRGTP